LLSLVIMQLAVNTVANGLPLAWSHLPVILYPPSTISAVPVAAPLPARHTCLSAKILPAKDGDKKPPNHPAPAQSVTTHPVLPSIQLIASSSFTTSGKDISNPPYCSG